MGAQENDDDFFLETGVASENAPNESLYAPSALSAPRRGSVRRSPSPFVIGRLAPSPSSEEKIQPGEEAKSGACKKLFLLCLQILVPTIALCTVIIGIIVSILRGVFERDFIDELTEIFQDIILRKMRGFYVYRNDTTCH